MNDLPRQRTGRWAGFDDLPSSDDLALARSMVAAFDPAEEVQWRHREDVLTFIDEHDEISVTFVTVRNGGQPGDAMLDQHRIPARVRRLAHPGQHRREEPDDAPRPVFLGRPVDWTPTTWTFISNRLST